MLYAIRNRKFSFDLKLLIQLFRKTVPFVIQYPWSVNPGQFWKKQFERHPLKFISVSTVLKVIREARPESPGFSA
jgi:hypothetical protein